MAPRIYFFCGGEADNFQHEVVLLAEGLRELGMEFFASSNYWRRAAEGKYLFEESLGVDHRDCDIVIVSSNWFNWIRFDGKRFLPAVSRDHPEQLSDGARRFRSVYIDCNDGYKTVSWRPGFACFDVILRAHFNARCAAPPNVRPWQFGVSGRMLEAIGEPVSWSAREPTVLVNFGASHGVEHSCRLASQRLLKRGRMIGLRCDRTKDDLLEAPSGSWDRLMWEQTARRHCPAYYARLRRSQACACFCGDLIPPAPHDPGPLLEGGSRAKLRRRFWETVRVFDPRPDRIIQWDSWRFWETLAAGAVAFHVDLELHGVKMPVMPRNWEHYVGVDLRRPKATIERILDEPECLERIALQGREWALEHYSPRAVAERFLRLLGY